MAAFRDTCMDVEAVIPCCIRMFVAILRSSASLSSCSSFSFNSRYFSVPLWLYSLMILTVNSFLSFTFGVTSAVLPLADYEESISENCSMLPADKARALKGEERLMTGRLSSFDFGSLSFGELSKKSSMMSSIKLFDFPRVLGLDPWRLFMATFFMFLRIRVKPVRMLINSFFIY